MQYFLIAQANQSDYSGFILMGVMLVVLYLFIIRPQRRKQKQQKEYIQALKEGNLIVTLGGLHGKILSLSGETLEIEIAKGTRVTIERSSISYDASLRRQQS